MSLPKAREIAPWIADKLYKLQELLFLPFASLSLYIEQDTHEGFAVVNVAFFNHLEHVGEFDQAKVYLFVLFRLWPHPQ